MCHVEREMLRLQFVPHRESCLHYSNQPQKYGYLCGKAFVLKSEQNWHLSTSISKIPATEIPRKSVWWESNSQNHPKTCRYTVWLRNSALSSRTPVHAVQCSVSVNSPPVCVLFIMAS